MGLQILEGISDHEIIYCTIRSEAPTPVVEKCSTFYDFSNADDASIIYNLSFKYAAFEKLSMDASVDVDALWKKYTEIFFSLRNYVPMKTKKSKESKSVDNTRYNSS